VEVGGEMEGRLRGAGELRMTGSGNLQLGGDNSGLTGSVFVQNTPGNAVQGSVMLGNNNSRGTGTVCPAPGAVVAAGIAGLTINNRVITSGFSLAPGNDLTILNSVDLLQSASIGVNGQNTLTIGGIVSNQPVGGIGEINGS